MHDIERLFISVFLDSIWWCLNVSKRSIYRRHACMKPSIILPRYNNVTIMSYPQSDHSKLWAKWNHCGIKITLLQEYSGFSFDFLFKPCSTEGCNLTKKGYHLIYPSVGCEQCHNTCEWMVIYPRYSHLKSNGLSPYYHMKSASTKKIFRHGGNPCTIVSREEHWATQSISYHLHPFHNIQRALHSLV